MGRVFTLSRVSTGPLSRGLSSSQLSHSRLPYMSHSQASSARLHGAQQRQKAVDLRLAGWNYNKIGKALGISRQRARVLVLSELEKLQAENTLKAETLQHLEAERLDRLLESAWPKAVGKGRDLKAAELVLKVLDRKMRLFGLGATRVKVEAGPSLESMTEEALIEEARR